MTRGPGTIRARVAAATFLVLAVSLGVAAAVIDESAEKIAFASLDRHLESDANILSSLVGFEDGHFEFEFGEVSRQMTGFSDPASGVYYEVRIGDSDFRSTSLGEKSLLSPETPFAEDGAMKIATVAGPFEPRVRVATRSVKVKADGIEATLKVIVARSLAPVAEARRTVRQALAIALPLALLLGTLGAFLVARRATRPIARMTDEARAIEPGALDRRIDVANLEGELRALAVTLNEAFDRLADGIARERRLSADASHELRTPLAILRSRTELALTRERTAEEYRAALASNLDAAIRLERIVESLLLLARGQAGKLVEAGGPVDLAQAAERAVQGARDMARAANVELELTAPSAVPVLGNAPLLERLVANLVENALRHGSAGRKVEVEVASTPDRAVLLVRDHGPGISREDAEKIFRPFVRLDASRERATGGSGLGLALVRTIARAHKGEASVEPTPGGGATFRVVLPLSALPERELQTVAPA